MGAPMGWPKAGDATALLIDHDVRRRRKHGAERVDQAGQLRRVLDVAAEQDNAGGRKGFEKRGLLRQQGGAGDADDRRGGMDRRHRLAATMSPPFPSMITACDVESAVKPRAIMTPTRMRHSSRGLQRYASAHR